MDTNSDLDMNLIAHMDSDVDMNGNGLELTGAH